MDQLKRLKLLQTRVYLQYSAGYWLDTVFSRSFSARDAAAVGRPVRRPGTRPRDETCLFVQDAASLLRRPRGSWTGARSWESVPVLIYPRPQSDRSSKCQLTFPLQV